MLEPQNLQPDNLNRDAIAKYKLDNSKKSTFREQILILVVATEKIIQDEKKSKSTVNLDLRAERERELTKLNAVLAQSHEPDFGYEDDSLYIACDMIARSARKGWFSVYNRFVERLNEILNDPLLEKKIHLRSKALRQVLKKQHQLDLAEIHLDIAKGRYLEEQQDKVARHQLDEILSNTNFEDIKNEVIKKFTSEMELAAIKRSVNEQYDQQIQELGESLEEALKSVKDMQTIEKRCSEAVNQLGMMVALLHKIYEEEPDMYRRLVKPFPKLHYLLYPEKANDRTSSGILAQRGLSISATSKKSPPAAEDREEVQQQPYQPM